MSNDTGGYALQIAGVVHIGIFPFPLKFPDTAGLFQGEYVIQVLPEGSPECDPSGIQELSGAIRTLQFAPNPTNGLTTITLETQTTGPATITLYDALGRPAMRRNTRLYEGINRLEMDVRDLAPGMYWYEVNQGKDRALAKLVVTQ